MLSETKLALRIKTDIYDGEIARLIVAAVGDLGIVDVEAAASHAAENGNRLHVRKKQNVS